MELTGSQRTKITRRVFLDRGAKSFQQQGRLEPRQRQMRRERPLFPRNAKFFRGLFDSRRQDFQIRRSPNTRPENARMFLVRKKPSPRKSILTDSSECTPASAFRMALNFASCTSPMNFSVT